TISQPYIVALMTQALCLQGGEEVLEIGTGSGYAAAVLAEIAGRVTTIETISGLAQHAEALLTSLGYTNIQVVHGDGTKGYSPNAPYDAIVVTAGGPEVPKSLKQQLKTGGRLVIPVGTSTSFQSLVRVIRESQDNFIYEDICDVRFVPLVGAEGWPVE
ncbi:MAG: protein-L-isoaspartate(D-aspartate) O-methyltransferase, partial [bacterium]